MSNTFSEVKLFQVKPDKLEEFEKYVSIIAEEQRCMKGCRNIRYMKRFYIFDDINENPRELTKIVKCVKYYSYWEFDSMEDYAEATHVFFDRYAKDLFKMLIMPFDINCGNTVA